MAEPDDEKQFLDYYDVLGVAWDTSDDELKRAYRKRARQWHPDANPDRDTDELFKLLGEAMAVLGDPGKRRVYDTPQPQFDPDELEFGDIPHGAGGHPVVISLRNVGRYRPDASLDVRRNFGAFWNGTSCEAVIGLHMLATFDIAPDVDPGTELGPKDDALIVEFEGVVASLRITADIQGAVSPPDPPGLKNDGGHTASDASRRAGSDARDRYRKADSARRRARTGDRVPSAPRSRPVTAHRRTTPRARPTKPVRPARTWRGSVRAIGSTVSDAYHFALAYTVTVLVLGGFVGLIGFAAVGGIIYKLHQVPGGPTQVQTNEGIAGGIAIGIVFAVFWYARMWRMKYHRRVSETWRGGPFGPFATICVLLLTTLLTVAMFPLILLGIALGMIQYD